MSKEKSLDDLIILANRFCTALLGGNGIKIIQKQKYIHDKTNRSDISL